MNFKYKLEVRMLPVASKRILKLFHKILYSQRVLSSVIAEFLLEQKLGDFISSGFLTFCSAYLW